MSVKLFANYDIICEMISLFSEHIITYTLLENIKSSKILKFDNFFFNPLNN